jgi:ligand-binding sensor domain-containing protein
MLKRITKISISLIFFLILLSSTCFASLTWWEVGVPYRVKIFAMGVLHNELYAGTWGKGVYRLSSEDNMWHEINDNLTNKEVRAIAVRGDDVYIGTWGGGIFKITYKDKGWINMSKGLTNNNVLSMVESDNVIYAGTWGSGVFMLADGSDEWVGISEGLLNKNINSLVSSEGDIYAGTDNGMFVLKKGTTKWESKDLSSIINCLAVGLDGDIYAGTQKGVYLLEKDSVTWKAKNRGLRDKFVLDMVISEKGSIFVGTNSGVFKLTKDARFFKTLNRGLTNTNIQSLHIAGIKEGKFKVETIFAGTSVGVYKSKVEDNPRSDKTEEWSQIKTGLTKTIVRALTINSRDIFAGTNKGVFKLTGGVGNWREINRGLDHLEIEALASNSGNIYAGTWGGGIFMLKENALRWEEVISPKKYIWSLASSGTKIYVGTWGGIYAFNVNDMSWVPINFNLNSINVYSIAASGGDLFIGTDKAVYKLPKNAREWEHYNEGLNQDDLKIYDLAIDDNDVFAATSTGVYLLRGGEGRFELINKGFLNPNVYALVSSGKHVYAGTWRDVFRFDKARNRWIEEDNGLSKNTSIMELLESGGDLYAGTYGEGVFAGSLPPVISTNNGEDFSTSEKKVLIEGTCYPYITAVKVNGSTDNVIYSPGSTTWSYKATLNTALNRYLVTNVNELGNESGFSEINIMYTGGKLSD